MSPGGIPHAQPPPPPPPPGELPRVRFWRLRRNPLRRTADLLQAWLGVGLLLAVLAAAPAAMFLAGDMAHRHYRDTAERQENARRKTPAVLVHGSARHPEPGSPEARGTRYPAEVRYMAPGGQARAARTDVPPGLPAGSTVEIWTDAHGRITAPPLTPGQIRSKCMGWSLLAALTVASLGALAYATTAHLLCHRNLTAWETAWSGTGPWWRASR
ncbi:hypothetical protein [Streptomyces sp. NPDC021356]|uniref:Rv1733c family protein n=1 Tax=Streptomyces sp. NPDC021356 TaxID=3154900 RepID=UPI00340AF922